MKVRGKIMYHCHPVGMYDEMWQPGSEISVDDKYNSYYGYLLEKFGLETKKCDSEFFFNKLISPYLSGEGMDLIDRQMMIDKLCTSNVFQKEYSVYKREILLEECRRVYFPHLPSRKNSIWLIDRNEVRIYDDLLSSKKFSIYRVSITGNLFKSSVKLISNNGLNFQDGIEKSKSYLDPKFGQIKNMEKEYIFQGKVKVLKKIR